MWTKRLPFKSLWTKQEEATTFYNPDYDYESDPFAGRDNFVYNTGYSLLLNENGFLMYADKILMINDNNLYIIMEKDFSLIERILNGENIVESDSVIKTTFSEVLTPNRDLNLKKNYEDRTNVIPHHFT